MKYTYREAFDLITEAYIKGEIEPGDPKFCFCGTLCNNTERWFNSFGVVHNDSHGYTGRELYAMENALFTGIETIVDWRFNEDHPQYEDALFAGMTAALEVLKQIHIERGEVIDSDVPVFTKRQLQTS